MRCPHFCSHGGVCLLFEGHPGLHDAGWGCTWSDAESIPEEQAAANFQEKVKLLWVDRDPDKAGT